MRAGKRGVCAAAVCIVLVLVTVPAGAEPEATQPKVAPLAAVWEVVSELWGDVAALWAPDTEEAPAAPGKPTSSSLEPCGVCTARGDDIDPNG